MSATLRPMTDAETTQDQTTAPAAPMPWHQELLEYLRTKEKDLWDWFSSNRVRADHADSVRLNLLRSTYRIEREADQQLYQIVDGIAEQMNVTVPVTVYQAQNSPGRNASLAWLPNEAHIVLYGDIQGLLSATDLGALIAHELAHHELYSIDDSAFQIVEQVLSAMLSDRSSQPPHERTWRTFQLYTELYCDRRALDVSGEVDNVVCMLIKMETGLKEVSAAAYCAQADEILAGGITESDEVTHPETFIRAKALSESDKHRDSADDIIRPLIEGPWKLSELDLLRQAQLTRFTEQFLRDFLRPKWLQTRIVLGHARRFFVEFTWDSPGVEDDRSVEPPVPTAHWDTPLRSYLCYLLLDFVTTDPELEDAPLAAAFLFADQHGLKEIFEEIATKELRLGKRHFQRLLQDAAEIVVAAEKEFAE